MAVVVRTIRSPALNSGLNLRLRILDEEETHRAQYGRAAWAETQRRRRRAHRALALESELVDSRL
jgi:hypothetical protein